MPPGKARAAAGHAAAAAPRADPVASRLRTASAGAFQNRDAVIQASDRAQARSKSR